MPPISSRAIWENVEKSLGVWLPAYAHSYQRARCFLTYLLTWCLAGCPVAAEQNAASELDKLNARIDALVSGLEGKGSGGAQSGALLVAEVMKDTSALHEALVAHPYLHKNHYLVAKAGYLRWEVHRGGGGDKEGRDRVMVQGLRSFLDGLRASIRPGACRSRIPPSS